jgi:hypothetical protein
VFDRYGCQTGCGELSCPCAPLDCAPCSPGCHYEGAEFNEHGCKTSCGTLHCVGQTPPETVHGWLTGGGQHVTSTGGSVKHNIHLSCDKAADYANGLTVSWGNGNKFELTTLNSVSCSTVEDSSHIGFSLGLSKEWTDRTYPFTQLQGSCSGKFNGVTGASATFTFTDNGEGSHDRFACTIKDASGRVQLQTSGTLRYGDYQCHRHH